MSDGIDMLQLFSFRHKGTTIFRDVQEKLRITTEGGITFLVGLWVLELVAIQWAKENNCVVDMFGAFATTAEILAYMKSRGFEAQERDGVFSDRYYLLSDIKPKNVLASEDGLAIFVIDADVQLN